MSTERTDIASTLGKHRALFLSTVRDLTDEQGLLPSTVSALTLTSLLKHVADTEKGWAEFITKGPAALGGDVDWSAFDGDGGGGGEFVDTRFVVEPGETLAVLTARYAEVARTTDELVATVDLDSAQPLPKAPWFEAGANWSARRVFLHIIAETAQHAGHADIIREAIDGAKTMG
ncbi:DinB family protein [Pseudonocardia sp. GCM10023141]|uniref:DinB family protein n=1 Tax=Pseudonocardia sp. GCM10023141 TaxID=3252653 RepID=UPI00361FAC55